MKTPEELRAYNRRWRKDNAERYKELCRRSNKVHAKRIRDERKVISQSFICEYLSSHACVDCQESDILVLDFDHLPQFKKRKTLSELINQGYKLKDIKDEIVKCEVVCSNCHRRRTARRRPCFKWRYLHLN